MFTAAEAIAKLDAALVKAGFDAVLRRTSGTTPSTGNVDVTVRASARGALSSELVGGMDQLEALVVVSPTPLTTANWPTGDADKLPRKLDRLIWGGKTRTVQSVEPFYMAGVLVRIEMRVTG